MKLKKPPHENATIFFIIIYSDKKNILKMKYIIEALSSLNT